MKADKHVVYILKCKDHTYYTGYTNDLEHRMRMHEEGKGAKYTRGRGPFTLVFTQSFSTKREAMQAEWLIKTYSRAKKEQLIKGRFKVEPAKELSEQS